MKLTKKAAALLLAAALAVSVCATPVFADGGTANTPEMGSQEVKGTSPVGIGVGHTSVLYKVTESYIWSVPTTIDFGVNAGVNNTSTVEAKLDKDQKGEQAKQESGGTAWKGTAPKVVVSKNVIGIGKNLKITVDTQGHSNTSYENGQFFVKPTGTNEKLYFTISKPTAGGNKEDLTGTNNEVLKVPSGTDTSYQELVFTLKTADNTTGNVAEKAGTYEGVVAFSSSIVD